MSIASPAARFHAGEVVMVDGEQGVVVDPAVASLDPGLLSSDLFPGGYVVVAVRDGNLFARAEYVTPTTS